MIQESMPPADDGRAGLGRKAIRGAGATTVGQLVRMVLQVAGVIVLARLLTPEDYGLMALGLAVVGLGEIFRDAGLSTAAIRNPHLTTPQRDTLFWLNTGIGAVLGGLCAAAAPLLALAFGLPGLTMVLVWLAPVFLLNGLAAQYRASLTRDLRFLALAVIDISAQVLGLVLAIVSALWGAGVYALVVQTLSAAVVTLLMSAIASRWLPGPPRRRSGVRPMVRFGLGMVGAQVLGYLNSNVDTFVIGARLDVASLGLYNRGFQLLMRPLGQMRGPSATVAVPVLSKLSGDDPKAAHFIVRGQLAMGYTIIPVLAVAVGTAGPLMAVALGPGWSQVNPIFTLLAIAGAMQTLSFVGYWVYVSRGLSAQLFRYSLISLAIKVVCVAVGSQWGIVGVAFGFMVATAVSWPISLAWLARLTTFPATALYGGALRILVVAAVIASAAYAAVMVVSSWDPVAQLLIGVLAALVAYALMAVVVPFVRRDVVALVGVVRRGVQR